MKKKLLVLSMGVGLSFALLTGCGTPKAEKLVDKMYETQPESAKMAFTFDIDVAADIDGEDYSAKASGNADVEMEGIGSDEMIAYVNGSGKYNVAGLAKGDKDIEAYITQEDGESTVYFYDENSDTWYYSTAEDVTGSDVDLDEKDIAKINDAAKAVWYKAKVGKKLVEKGGEKCYELTLTTTFNDYLDVIGTVTDVADVSDEWDDMIEELEDELDCEASELFDCFVVETKAYVSKSNGYLVASSVDFSGIDIEKLLEVLDYDWDDISELAGVTVDGVTINSLYFDMEMSDINNVEVSLSKDAKKAVDINEYYNDYDWDDDYDYDEDDYDWSDDEEDYDDSEGDIDYSYSDGTEGTDYYDATTGFFKLLSFWTDDVLIEAVVPTGFSMTYASEDGTSYNMMDDSWNTISIYGTPSSYAKDYLTDGTIPTYYDFDEDDYIEYSDYECTAVDMPIAGYESMLVSESYSDSDGWEYEYNYFWVPYVDDNGAIDYIQFTISNDLANTISLADLESLLNEMLDIY